jgi:hypothetical protein
MTAAATSQYFRKLSLPFAPIQSAYLVEIAASFSEDPDLMQIFTKGSGRLFSIRVPRSVFCFSAFRKAEDLHFGVNTSMCSTFTAPVERAEMGRRPVPVDRSQ